MIGGLDIRRKQALFRAQRRGFKELDIIFGAFAEAHLERLTEAQLDRFDTLLNLPDWQIYDWIAGHESVPETFNTDVFVLLRSYRPKHVS